MLFVCITCVLSACNTPSDPPPPEHPNIVFILADDMGYGDPAVYNADSKIPTPYMDQIANEGIRFTDAHSPSGVCTPTRYGLLTGRYSWRTRLKKGVTRGYSANLIDTTRITLATLLKEEGYHTAVIGKWHLGLGSEEPLDYSGILSPGPRAHEFDYYFGIPASLDMIPYVYVENEHVVELPTDSVGPSGYEYGGPYWRPGPIAPSFKHIDVMPDITAKAVNYIDERASDEEKPPFFLYFPLPAPHTPWLPTDEFIGTSSAGEYGDFTVQVDHTVGQVLEALDRNGFTDNTLIIVASDNGSFWIQEDIERYDHLSNLNLRGIKADIHEGGHRIPLIARWPGTIPAGLVNDDIVSLTDFLATFADILDVELADNEGEDSFSLYPIMQNASDVSYGRDHAIHHSSEGMFAIRKGDWKLIEGRGSGGFTAPRFIDPAPGEPTGQLYNMKDDLQETQNLYLENPEVVAELTALLNKYRDEGRSR